MSERRLETWRNACRGRIGVLKLDRFGQLVSETIKAGGTFQITTEERMINSERAATPQLDVFSNGYLTPVRILDDVEDAKQIASNPNLLGEAELRKLFKGTQKAFAEKLSQITNSNTIRRLLDLTEEDDIDASLKHVKMIKARLVELEPELVAEVEVVDSTPVSDFGKPVSP